MDPIVKTWQRFNKNEMCLKTTNSTDSKTPAQSVGSSYSNVKTGPE